MQGLFDEEISLQTLQGRPVLLSFYRYASCPLCNLRINELIAKHPGWSARGLQMIAVFQSPRRSIEQYVGRQDAPFPIIADPGQQLYAKYGVEGHTGKFLLGITAHPVKMLKAFARGFLPGKIETELTMIPADFLIDKDGVIEQAYYGKDASDHIPLAVIDGFLNQSA
jgi:peroxiredoxin